MLENIKKYSISQHNNIPKIHKMYLHINSIFYGNLCCIYYSFKWLEFKVLDQNSFFHQLYFFSFELIT